METRGRSGVGWRRRTRATVAACVYLRSREREGARERALYRASSFSRALVVTVAVSNHRLPFDLVGAQPIVDST